MKILIAGSHGQLGNILEKKLKESHQVYGFSSTEMDITNKDRVFSVVKEILPHLVINCASYNKVDDAEKYKEIARAVNVTGTINLADITQHIGAKMFHVSTDYVFDGTKNSPYKEIDHPSPINYYGYTKYLSEKAVQELCNQYILLRTSWLYSRQDRNFVSTMIKLAKERDNVKVVDDQIGSPTNADELSDTIKRLIDNDCYGVFHCSGNGACSWYEFASRIVQLANIPCNVEKISSKEYKQQAKRPKYSVLDNYNLRHTIGDEMKDWEESLEEFFKTKTIKSERRN